MSDLFKPEYYDGLLKKYGFTETEDIFGAVGYGGMAAVYVVSRLIEEQRARETPAVPDLTELPDDVIDERRLSQRRANHGIVMTGNEDLNIPIRFAKCCSPVPGDDIIGYITRGRGVTVHKAECLNAINGEPERQVAVTWADVGDSSFLASLKVIAYDRVNLLGEIATIIGEMNVSIKAANAQTDDKSRICTFRLTLDVTSKEQMEKVIQALRRKSDILDVYRVTG